MENTLQKGIYTAVLTPLNEDLSINHEELYWHCKDLIHRGCQGIALFGTTGEGPSFSVSERTKTLERLLSYGFDPKKIILGNGSSGIADTVALSRAALKYGCAAVLTCPPSFYKNVKEEGVIAYYRAIIQQIDNPDLRILLYHFPQRSGVPITLPIIESLRKDFPKIVVGLKESEGNLSFTHSILARFSGFQVFVGNELHIVEAVHHGASGSICGIANLYPEMIQDIYKKKLHLEKLASLFHALKGIDFIAAAKSIMEARRGNSWHTLCPPSFH